MAMDDSAVVFTTERLTVSHVHCERNEELGMCGRDVYIAFHRLADIPAPLCMVTLCGNWVEWIETKEGYRRNGFAREMVDGLEKHVGCLEMTGVTGEGKAFVEAVCGPIEQEQENQ
jgi:hypothetical protein